MVAAVTVLSLIPVEVDLGEGRDKLAHFAAYGSLTFWFAIMVRGRGRSLGVAIAFAGMGVVIEFLQGMTGYRDFEVADMVANAIGAALGWGLAQTPLRNVFAWLEGLFPGARAP
jgi:VanZ family protein